MATVPQTADPVAAPRAKLPIGMLIVVLLAAIGGSAGVSWLIAGRIAVSDTHKAEATEHGEDSTHAEGKKKEGVKAPPEYFTLDPAFVVALADTDAPHYLQIDVQLMARDAAGVEAAKLHSPVLRNNLLMMFAEQHAADLRSREGREALRQKALAEIQRILEEETGKPGVEAIYFTSFVVQ